MGTSGLRRLLGRLGVLVRVQTEDPVVALTFDDGPDPVSTPAILDVLERHGARATFFVDGPAASRHPGVLRRLEAAGHVVAVHGWSHESAQQSPSMRTFRRQVSDIEQCARAAGRPTRLYRPPYGHESTWTRPAAIVLGYQTVYWSAAVHDWEPADAAHLSTRLVDAFRPGAIVLLHDRLRHATDPSVFDRAPLVEALDSALRSCDRMRFVTVPELLEHGSAVHRFRRRSAPELPPMVEQQV